MPYVAYSRSPIRVRETHGIGDVDPGFGNEHPGFEPPEVVGPIDPGFGVGLPPVDPGYGHPAWGPTDPGYGNRPPVDPGYGRPTYPVRPDHDLPTPPNRWPMPPRPVRPGHDLPGRPPHVGGGPAPGRPDRPDQGLPPSGARPGHDLPVPISPSHPIYLPPPGVDNALPLPPGAVWPPLPPSLGETELLCFVWIVGIGYRWTVIDTSLKPGMPLPPTTVPPVVDNTLPETPEPKA